MRWDVVTSTFRIEGTLRRYGITFPEFYYETMVISYPVSVGPSG